MDPIDRQSAIDKFEPWLKVEGYSEGERNMLKAVLYELTVMPSAQPERRWIPCSERLPKHGGRYLISVLDGIGRRTTVAPYLPRCKAWTMTGRMAYWKVIAWMPLPEPYQNKERRTDE